MWYHRLPRKCTIRIQQQQFSWSFVSSDSVRPRLTHRSYGTHLVIGILCHLYNHNVVSQMHPKMHNTYTTTKILFGFSVIKQCLAIYYHCLWDTFSHWYLVSFVYSQCVKNAIYLHHHTNSSWSFSDIKQRPATSRHALCDTFSHWYLRHLYSINLVSQSHSTMPRKCITIRILYGFSVIRQRPATAHHPLWDTCNHWYLASFVIGYMHHTHTTTRFFFEFSVSKQRAATFCYFLCGFFGHWYLVLLLYCQCGITDSHTHAPHVHYNTTSRWVYCHQTTSGHVSPLVMWHI